MHDNDKPNTLPHEIDLGLLPAKRINATLGMDLEAAKVVLKRAAMVHAKKRHPHDFDVCLPYVGTITTDPLYVRDDFKNPGKIELIGRIPIAGSWALVAVDVTLDAQGRYNIASFYRISKKNVQKRRASGHLKNLMPAK